MSQVRCHDCQELMPGINAYVAETTRLLLCQPCKTRRNTACLFCDQIKSGYWSYQYDHHVCELCAKKQGSIIKEINSVWHPPIEELEHDPTEPYIAKIASLYEENNLLYKSNAELYEEIERLRKQVDSND